MDSSVRKKVGGDDILLCAVDGNDLCRSCEEDSDAMTLRSLHKIGQLTYCGEDCSDSGDCPEGFDLGLTSERGR